MNIYLYLGYNQILLYCVAQTVLVLAIRSSFSWLLCSSDIPLPSMCFSEFCFHFYFFEHSPTRWHCKILQDAHLVCFLPFLQGALTPLLGEWLLVTTIWVLGMLVATGLSFLLGDRAACICWQGNTYVFILTYVYTHIYKYFHMQPSLY